MREYLAPGRFIDSDHPSVVQFAEDNGGQSLVPRDRAVSLYYAVRDGIRYNPYSFSRDPETLKGSAALLAGQSYCVPKATLLAACARHFGIPSRIGLADVRNHLSTPRLLEALRSEVFAMHGYTELYLEGRWVKATPAFNLSLCELFKVAPLEFDGLTDSVFQPYNEAGQRHMEYLVDHASSPTCRSNCFSATYSTATPICLPPMHPRSWVICTRKWPAKTANHEAPR